MSRTEIVDGPRPKHVQLRDILRRLAEQELPPGAAIPSERDLARQYGVSRITVRAAVGQLVAEGLLTRAKGRGTFTARRRMDVQLYLESFTDDMRRRGLLPATDVVECVEEVPPTEVSVALGLTPHEPAYRLVRLRRADGVPLAVERGWYNPRLVPDLTAHDLSESLYTLLADTYGVQLDHAGQTVWAEGSDVDTARLLGVRTGSPLLVFRRLTGSQGRPVEDMTSWYRGDLYQVTMQLDRTVPESGPTSAKGGTS
ncbi:GntR family transcriptional regulator [Saccharothrix violaceirubra]|uniref:GntR family transcriptional regulator n=1 Tax=Saccharothrix violaceirubra TaxID=413306 RepID=A0A7W7T0Z9_9PSEU|nr:GntR family transcriptional regulator [Saccharothrix violaceirubra]MBB4964582.1 GntR family transcriptional regulator [Saccharothrix violaceirubra]